LRHQGLGDRWRKRIGFRIKRLIHCHDQLR
jgi:hypothetical protein